MWQTRLYPELLRLDTDIERKKLLRDARIWGRGGRWSWRRLLVILGIYVGIIALSLFLRRAWSTNVYIQQWTGLVRAGVVGGFAVWALDWIWRRPLRDQIRRELIKRGILICQRCGYNLTGLAEPRCPECGTTFDPRESAS